MASRSRILTISLLGLCCLCPAPQAFALTAVQTQHDRIQQAGNSCRAAVDSNWPNLYPHGEPDPSTTESLAKLRTYRQARFKAWNDCFSKAMSPSK